MSRRIRVFLLLTLPVLAGLLVLPSGNAGAQQRREVRAVWLTTLLGLDWPAASLRGNVQAQKQALRDILDDLQRQRYNTVFFQVRSRGNAMYRSAYEPWASELTGVLGRDPGWDPLAFAIEECHDRGMQLHAWFNVNRVWSKGEPPACTPLHVTRLHPEWVQRFGDDLWVDAGIPEARAWTVNVAEDLVRNYAVDGLH
ncbi:MAG: family 10 glycosylhydrolase, partial [Bacteroidetes bacterium]|nr:family 10 glycosylhydrolase [Bacteroidota bacterium]